MKKVRLEVDLDEGWQQISLDAAARHHLCNVQRALSGEKVLLVDKSGRRFFSELGENGCVKRMGDCLADTEPPYRVHLIQGMPKGDKWEFILQKGVELGATDFYPLNLQRSIARVKKEDLSKKVIRWNKIIAAAALQSGRTGCPIIHPVTDLKACVAELALLPNTLRVVAWEEERSLSLADAISDYRKHCGIPEHICIVIGPEGGLAADEIGVLKGSGFQVVSLGRRILRTETAGIMALANLTYEFE